VPLNLIYHYVLAQSPSSERAKIAISEARKRGQLRLRAEVREHEARSHLRFRPGEPIPESQPKSEFNQTILPTDKFSFWDWERARATRRKETTKSLFEYVDIVGSCDDVLGLWPGSGTTTKSETAETAAAKPVGVSRLVWAVVLALDDMERETPAEFAALMQQQLTGKAQGKAGKANLY
jgi:hypothetical protein